MANHERQIPGEQPDEIFSSENQLGFINSVVPYRIRAIFLGEFATLRPDVIQRLTPRDGYILFVYSDYRNTRTYQELADMFGISSQRVEQIYKTSLRRVWRTSPAELKDRYSLEALLSVKPEGPERPQKESPSTAILESLDEFERRWEEPSFMAELERKIAEFRRRVGYKTVPKKLRLA